MGLSLHRFCREGLGVGPGVASGPAVLLGQCESGWRGERRESQRLHFFHTHPGVAGSPWLLRLCALSPELQRTQLQLTVLGTVKSIALRLLGLQFPVPGVLLSAAPWRWEGSSWDRGLVRLSSRKPGWVVAELGAQVPWLSWWSAVPESVRCLAKGEDFFDLSILSQDGKVKEARKAVLLSGGLVIPEVPQS